MGLRAKDSPHYFEKAQCSKCGGFELELMKHKFSDVLTCVECVNEELEEIAKLEPYEKQPSSEDVCRERNM